MQICFSKVSYSSPRFNGIKPAKFIQGHFLLYISGRVAGEQEEVTQKRFHKCLTIRWKKFT